MNYSRLQPEAAAARVARHHERALKLAGMVSQVTVNADGRRTQFELTADGQNILDGALDNGVDLPFACKGGVCATCKAKLLEGEVDMDINHALEADEVGGGLYTHLPVPPDNRQRRRRLRPVT